MESLRIWINQNYEKKKFFLGQTVLKFPIIDGENREKMIGYIQLISINRIRSLSFNLVSSK